MSAHSSCVIAPSAFPCIVELFLIFNGETFWIGCDFVKKLEKSCGLIFVHVCGENQLCDLKINACSERSPRVFFSWDVGRSWKISSRSPLCGWYTILMSSI